MEACINYAANSYAQDLWSDLSVVYFVYINNSPGEVLKVGYSADFGRRMIQLSKPKHGVEFIVKPLCVVRGSTADEQHILRYFALDRLDNERETFHPTQRLQEYIRWLRDQSFTWVPDNFHQIEDGTNERCEIRPKELGLMPSDVWMPNESRRKPQPEDLTLFPVTSDFGSLNFPRRETMPDDYYTNKKIISAARQTMGDIDLDPASHAIANSIVKARRIYQINDDGLKQEWCGRIWLNPPFSEWRAWVPKIVSEWQSGRVCEMCVLCATRTLTAQYFKPITDTADAMCITSGRYPFWGSRAGDSPDDGHAIFYFGYRPTRFIECFSEIGSCFHSSNQKRIEIAV